MAKLTKKEYMWFAISDHFLALFRNHRAAFEYRVNHDVPPLLENDSFFDCAVDYLSPWEFTPKQCELMHLYGITDQEIRDYWKKSCEWADASEDDFPCPLP